MKQILPGVWKMTMGMPEEHTPVKYATAPPKVEALEKMGSHDAPLCATGDITCREAQSGCVIEIPCKDAEALYGFGLQLKSFRQTGLKKQIRSNADPKADSGDSHAPVPFFVSINGWGLYVDTARYVSFYCGSSEKKGARRNKAKPRRESLVYSVEDLYGKERVDSDYYVLIDIPGAKGADLYFFAGDHILEAVQRYNLFSGGGCVPPEWGLGVWYRAYGGGTTEDILHLARHFRDEDLPCDVFGLEPGWQSHSYSCSYTWDTTSRIANPEKFIRDMTDLNLKINLWEHAFVHPTAPFYDAIYDHCGDFEVWEGLVPDFADKQARNIFGDYHKTHLVDKGVASFKLDECDGSDFTCSWSFPNCAQFPSGLDGEQMHNLIGVLYQQVMEQMFRENNQRSYHLVRNSHALAAPLPFVLYSDLYDHSDFIRGVCNMGFSGLLWTPEVRDAKTPEDLIRRIQAAVLSPQALVNCWAMPLPSWRQLDWRLSLKRIKMEHTDELTELVRDCFKLRMQLIPYLYAEFVRYAQDGTPPFRALVMDWSQDKNTHKIDNQYMVGDSLLACPVTEGNANTTIYLPQGNWYQFYTGEKIMGGRLIDVEVPIDQIALYVKENTILPLAKPVMHTERDGKIEITARVYGQNPQNCVLYEDDGQSMDYLCGVQNTVVLSAQNGEIIMHRSGNYPIDRIVLKEVERF